MSEPTMPPPYNPPPASPTGNTVSPNRTIMIVLAYLGLLALIPLLVEKDDSEVQWHAKHGLVLCVADIVLWIGFMVLSWILAFVHLGCAGCVLYCALLLIILVVHVMCIVKGVNGQRFIIPGISDFANRF